MIQRANLFSSHQKLVHDNMTHLAGQTHRVVSCHPSGCWTHPEQPAVVPVRVWRVQWNSALQEYPRAEGATILLDPHRSVREDSQAKYFRPQFVWKIVEVYSPASTTTTDWDVRNKSKVKAHYRYEWYDVGYHRYDIAASGRRCCAQYTHVFGSTRRERMQSVVCHRPSSPTNFVDQQLPLSYYKFLNRGSTKP